ISLSIMLSGCGSRGPAATQGDAPASGTESSVEASGESSAVSDTSAVSDESPKAETSSPKEGSEDAGTNADALLNVVNHTIQIPGGKDTVILAKGIYPEITLTDSYAATHRELREALEEYDQETERSCRSTVAELGITAKECLAQSDNPYGSTLPFTDENKAEILRLDDQVLVVSLTYYQWGGGAHPMSGTTYSSWDVNTGKQLKIKDLMNHSTGLSGVIYDEIKKNYSDNEEIMTYDPTSTIEELIGYNTLNCAPFGGTLNIHFDQYEIASYAAGDFDVSLSPDEYGVYLNKSILDDRTKDLKTLVSFTEAEPEEVEAGEDMSIFAPDCPSWSHYNIETVKPCDSHIELTETFKESTDWLNTDEWEYRHNFKKPGLPYNDGTWIYEPTSYRQYQYMTNAIDIVNVKTEKTISLDLTTLMDGPDNVEHSSSAYTQYLRYAACKGDVIYLSVGHNTYSSAEPNSSYIAAVDIRTGEVLWKSDPLVSNANNFLLTDTTVICGYGFTSEDDFIYLLDINTGETVKSIPVKSGPDEFQIVDDTLYVATYNTEYEFKITGN
ncbi:MAG: RsiV family protein, partial [Lachnospiraceae bacterium]|nr:RsiV family protein [Lachnospiraceae bacterium]